MKTVGNKIIRHGVPELEGGMYKKLTGRGLIFLHGFSVADDGQ
jgi:hypothetical protein